MLESQGLRKHNHMLISFYCDIRVTYLEFSQP